MFFKFKIKRQLKQDGIPVDVKFLVYVNNDDPCEFATKVDVVKYLSTYRENTEIHKLQIFKSIIYSL